MKKDKKEIIESNEENEEIIKDEEEKNSHSKKGLIKFILFLFITLLFLFLWSRYISTKGLIIKEYPLESNKILDTYDGAKIVQFSDLHYGSTVGIKELKEIVKKINNQNPDVIVFTGDLIDQDKDLNDTELNNIITELDKLNPKIETIAISGEEDYKSSYFETITTKLNWIVINNSYEYVYINNKTPIVFVGLDDLEKGNPNYKNAFSFKNETEEDIYTIVLLHEPDQIDYIADYEFDVAFAGHSHLGQIRLPMIGAIYTNKGSKNYYDETYKINKSTLYINGGIGTSKINNRFLCKPSINLYRLYTK